MEVRQPQIVQGGIQGKSYFSSRQNKSNKNIHNS